ncbi:replication-associated recombination protein A [soil metagenome]
MNDLFAERRQSIVRGVEPLAARMRPRTLEEFAGQAHILGPGKLLRRMLAADAVTSLILHGPPGTGKTTLARVIAAQTQRHFEAENAAGVGVARIREISATAERRLVDGGRRTVLFLDEIHRFTKAQQDVLLGDVERGLITLIGATTENPLFAVNSALVSRSTLLRLEPLSVEDVKAVLRRAVADVERGYGALDVRVEEEALEVWAVKSDGDARRALTALEVAVLSLREEGKRQTADGNREDTEGEGGAPPGAAAARESRGVRITRAIAEESIQQKAIAYDPTGDGHYDTISAFIKSVRGSDPDAALYWMAHMLEAGEDPRFIARRLAILASEDIGNADPRGIMVAQSCWELLERIGMPEGRIILAQCVTYLALAPKSNASYLAIEAALADVKSGRSVAVPSHIKDTNVRRAGEKSVGSGGNGEGYKYAHSEGVKSEGLGMIGTQDYLGVSAEYYHPTEHGVEKVLKERLEEARRVRRAARSTRE